jgi:hypothetical protein
MFMRNCTEGKGKKNAPITSNYRRDTSGVTSRKGAEVLND